MDIENNSVKKPVLVVMAAGMGTRYGGLKQIDPMGPNGEFIIDYSLFDGARAGFEKVIFIIKHEIERDFKSMMENRIPKSMEAVYAFQDIDDIPTECPHIEGRQKPWGTAHAVCAARNMIDTNFAVINADDFYGAGAFKEIFDFLCRAKPTQGKENFAMVAYKLKNTLTDNGYVSRGVCKVDKNNMLKTVTECTKIKKGKNGSQYEDEDGIEHYLDGECPVSMNLWGFSPKFIETAWKNFPRFLQSDKGDPLKKEYYLPTVVTKMIQNGTADVKVLTSSEKWYGVTYREDKPIVKKALYNMHRQGKYPKSLWGK
jgi:hypothetical protein